jgi:hypothetical protein
MVVWTGFSLRAPAGVQVDRVQITAFVTLAMAIAANAVVFSVMNGGYPAPGECS